MAMTFLDCTGALKVTLKGLVGSETLLVSDSPTGLLFLSTGVRITSLAFPDGDLKVRVTQTGVVSSSTGLSTVRVVLCVPATLVTFSLSLGTTPWFSICCRQTGLGLEAGVVPGAVVVGGATVVTPLDGVVGTDVGVVPGTGTVVGIGVTPGVVVPAGADVVVSSSAGALTQTTAETTSALVGCPTLAANVMTEMDAAGTGSSNLTSNGLLGSVTVTFLVTSLLPFLSTAVTSTLSTLSPFRTTLTHSCGWSLGDLFLMTIMSPTALGML